VEKIVCLVLAFSVLYLSTEGLWDMAKESHPHGNDYAHVLDNPDHQTIGDSDPLSDDCADHCANVCHGHLASIVGNNYVSAIANAGYQQYGLSSKIISHPLTPPTPPPNA